MTKIFASALLATSLLAGAASAQSLIPGSERQSDAADAQTITNVATGVYGQGRTTTTTQASSYGYPAAAGNVQARSAREESLPVHAPTASRILVPGSDSSF